MSPHFSSRSRSVGALPRITAMGAILLVLRRLNIMGPAYGVQDWSQGEWDPSRGCVALSVENDRLHLNYTSKSDDDKTLSFHMDEAQVWQVSLCSGDFSFLVQGQGPSFDVTFWEASGTSTAEGIGDMKVQFSSAKSYNLNVVRRKLAERAGFTLDALVQASNDGVLCHLDVRSQLRNDVDLSYSVENREGVYVWAGTKHVSCVGMPLAGGYASLRHEKEADMPLVGGYASLRHEKEADINWYIGTYTREILGGTADLRFSTQWRGGIRYNVSYARDFCDSLCGDANVNLGVDDAGAWGKFMLHRNLGLGVDAEYEARARVVFGKQHRRHFDHTLKMAKRSGYARLFHGTGQAPRLRLGYEFSA